MESTAARSERLRSSSQQRPPSSGSDTSTGSNLTSISMAKRPGHGGNQANMPSFIASNLATANSSQSSLPNYSRPSAPFMPQGEQHTRRTSPLGAPFGHSKHSRQHSQGYFEPSLPSASPADHSVMSNLSASQIAAQAAMQHLSMTSHARKRSQTAPSPQEPVPQEGRKGSRSSPPPPSISPGSETSHPHPSVAESQYRNGLVGNTAAATAANFAFPRNLGSQDGGEKEQKKGSKMRMFKPKHIGIIRDKDREAKDKPLTSPNKFPAGSSGLSRVVNASTTSLADSVSSKNTLYSLNNASSSTIIAVPPSDAHGAPEKEKPHKHGGLRQKLKLQKVDDHHTLGLSSASSNSKVVDSDHLLYSFEPSSPGPNSNFTKSVSGLDLRHAGRALRDKKSQVKALVSSSSQDTTKIKETESSDWPLPLASSLSTSHIAPSIMSATSGAMTPAAVDPASRDTLAGFGLSGMTPDDAWDLLKAKILVVFGLEDVRTAVEDLNKLVTIYVQRCVQRQQPNIITEDLDELFHTGFSSLNHTIRLVPDDRLVPHLVSLWLKVFQSILPFIQAVFFPLDQEFKGRGTVLSTRDAAADFWGALPTSGGDGQIAAGDELEVRRMLLISFRDTVILPRYDTLKGIFSRLSLDSLNTEPSTAGSLDNSNIGERPSTAQSLDPKFSSFNSQSSTLLGSASAGRSRATSNTSNPAQDIAFQSLASPPAARPTDSSSSQVTETVGRMLQCVSVLASVQSGDEAQAKMEELSKDLKLNWLGRGRTGRNRRGFIGTRVRHPRTDPHRRQSEGSPTPTPTRAGTINDGDSKRTAGSGMPGAFPASFGRSLL